MPRNPRACDGLPIEERCENCNRPQGKRKCLRSPTPQLEIMLGATQLLSAIQAYCAAGAETPVPTQPSLPSGRKAKRTPDVLNQSHQACSTTSSGDWIQEPEGAGPESQVCLVCVCVE